MVAILQRFDANLFEIIILGDDVLLNQPIEKWPVVDTLMSWYSAGFPLEKALAYVRLRQPFCVNNLASEHTLRDRRKFYAVLESAGISTPHHVVVNRDGPISTHSVVLEGEDAIEIDGVRINKPFVEKPADAEDHNIYIYYPRRLGGGSKRLFRKVGNVSSKFYPNENNIRAQGSYIYEEFIMTQGTDIKIYSVGPEYAHAEARKSPVVDGIVQRDDEGKELRFPIMLTNREKDTVRRVCLAFQQNVCGFDLLRTAGKSYVCDVNGWSFVKKSHKYYDDAAQLLMLMMLRAVAPERLHTSMLNSSYPPAGLAGYTRGAAGSERLGIRTGSPSSNISLFGAAGGSSTVKRDSSSSDLKGRGRAGGTSPTSDNTGPDGPDESQEELRCVAAIVRHGDRTPKQKMKMAVSHPDFLAIHKRYAKHARKEGKLKSAAQLQMVLEVTRAMIATRLAAMASAGPASPGRHGGPVPSLSRPAGQDDDHDTADDLDKLMQMKAVLEKGGHFNGINRKVQLKPTKWRQRAKKGSHSIVSEGLSSGGSDDVPLVPPPGMSSRSALSLVIPDVGRPGSEMSDGGGGESTGGGPTASGDAVTSSAEENADEEVVECLLVLKWGGVLTHAGIDQALSLGSRFRSIMYPGQSVGLLRLHSTYRHDLKIYSSDEGRVQMTAAAFVKGFLDLEGELTPILASLVKTVNTSNLLDDSDPARDVMMSLKKRLKRALTTSINSVKGLREGGVTDSDSDGRGRGRSIFTPAASRPRGPVRSTVRAPVYSSVGTDAGDADNECGLSALESPGLCGEPEGRGLESDEHALLDGGEPGSGAPPLGTSLAFASRLSSLAYLDLPSATTLLALEAELSSSIVRAIAPTRTASLLRALQVIGKHPLSTLHRIMDLIASLTRQLAALQEKLEGGSPGASRSTPALAAIIMDHAAASRTGLEGDADSLLCGGEALWLMLERWRKLHADLYSSKKGRFDLSKIPDVYDCIKYDAVHNGALRLDGVRELYTLTKAFGDLIVSQEYGIDVDEKADIAARIAHHLLRKVFFDMTAVAVEDTVEIQAAQAARAGSQAEKKKSESAKGDRADMMHVSIVSSRTGAGATPEPGPLPLLSASCSSEVTGSSTTAGEPAAFVGAAAPAPPLLVVPATAPPLISTVSMGCAAASLMRGRDAVAGLPPGRHVGGLVPVPLGTSVSSSKVLESSAVVGLVVSLHQHPSHAYTSRVRRKSAPSLLLRGMHKHPSLVDGHALGGFGPHIAAYPGVSPLGPSFNLWSSSRSRGSGLLTVGTPGATTPMSGPADDMSDGTSIRSGVTPSLTSPSTGLRDTVAKGTVLVPGMRLRLRAAATAAAAVAAAIESPLGSRSILIEGGEGEETDKEGTVEEDTRLGISPPSPSPAETQPAVHKSVSFGQLSRERVVSTSSDRVFGGMLDGLEEAGEGAKEAALQSSTSPSVPLTSPTHTTAGAPPAPGTPNPIEGSAMDLLAEDMHDIAETVHQLDARYMDSEGYGEVKTPQWHVRTRLYFTSESHVHALVNTLKYWALSNGRPCRANGSSAGVGNGPTPETSADGSLGEEAAQSTPLRPAQAPGPAGSPAAPSVQTSTSMPAGGDASGPSHTLTRLVTDEGQALLDSIPELDYLTHIVFRLYENFAYEHGHPKRHRVEILFSPGTSFSPFDGAPRTPRVASAPAPQQPDEPATALPRDILTPLRVEAERMSPSSFYLGDGMSPLDHSASPREDSSDSHADCGRFMSTAVKPPAAFTGPARAEERELRAHTLPVAPLLPLHLSLSLEAFEDVFAEAIAAGANLPGSSTQHPPAGGLSGGGGSTGGGSVGPPWGGAGGQAAGPGGAREQHPKVEAKARIAMAAARFRKLGDGYFA
jgi:hypothetical protein